MPSASRVFEHLRELDGLAAGGPGVDRLAFTAGEMAAREWLLEKLAELGADSEVDGMGNVFGWYPAAGDTGRLPIVMGSHLDSVPRGGRFDGALGVLCGLEMMRAAADGEVKTSAPIGLVSFSAEESSRFRVGCIGSQAVSGHLRPEQLEVLRDADGVTLGEAVAACGFSADLSGTARPSPWFAYYFEVHVEQGRQLHEGGRPIGLVTRIASPIREWIELVGAQGHSGAQPLSERRDALAGAAELVLEVERIAAQQSGRGVIATAGALRVEPGSINVIARRADLGLDVRGFDSEAIDETIDMIHERAAEIAARRRIQYRTTRLWDGSPVELSQDVLVLLKEACRKEGVETSLMRSWAGHDSIYMSHQGPTGLLFVRNPSGVSHQPEEEVWPEDVQTTLDVLAAAIEAASTEVVTSQSQPRVG